ncbi:MAG: hypothetical protein M1824_003714 [Vezdaea acicularis]|nr:MAG: hypothetical protein M1824_003714 [Vezdaea acicularis]
MAVSTHEGGLAVPEKALDDGATTPSPLPSEHLSTGKGSKAGSLVNSDPGQVEKGEVPVDREPPPRTVTGFLWALVVVSILSSTFLFALDNTIVADIQPAIIERFGDIGKLPWLSVAFLLGAVSTNLIWGKIYGQFNAKWLYIVTVFLFEAGSAICGAANNLDALIVGRAIAGVGGSGMYVGVMTLLSITTTEHERPTYIGMTGLTWGAGTVLGPIIGGAFTDSSVGWRFAFYLNLFVAGAFAPVYIWLLPSHDPRPGVKISSRFRHLDFLGTLLIIGAFLTGVMAISFGGNVYNWHSGRIIALFIISGLLFIAFGFQQVYCFTTSPEQRIFPIQFLKSKDLVILFAQTSSAGTAIFIPIYFIPLFFQFVKNDKALEAGVRLLPFVVLLITAVMANGILMTKYGYYMPWYVFAGVFTIIGAALMYTVDEHTTTARIYGYSILLAIGSGAACQASFSVAQAKVAPMDIPSAVGFITCAQIAGVTIALAIANSIFLNQSANNIRTILPDVPLETVRSAISGVGSQFFNTLNADQKAAVLHIIIASIGRTYILAITAGCVLLILSVFMPREKLFLAAAAAA